MKQIYARLVLVLFISLFFVGLIPYKVGASVEDFNFSSFDADYYLSKDGEGRSVMRVVERLTAEFKNFNQNKGINRAIPASYDGHSVSFKLESLKRNGQPEPIYEQKRDGKFEIVSTGTDEYVNGPQQYELIYMLRDVTKTFGNHQELYWDTNGTGWGQSFNRVTARVHLDESVIMSFDHDISCYQGPENSSRQCSSEELGSDIIFSSTGPLGAHENLTFNLGFASGTFADYKMTLSDMVPYILIGLYILTFVVNVIIKIRFGRNHPGKGTIVPEYLPPKGSSVLMSAEIFNKSRNSSTAQIIDMAVRHKIRIIEEEKKAFIGKTKEYSVELLSVDGLGQDELGLVRALFDNEQVGSKYKFTKNDSAMAIKMKKLTQSVKDESKSVGYREKRKAASLVQGLVLAAGALAAMASIYIGLSNDDSMIITPAILFFVIILSLNSVFKLYSIAPLTEKGRELFDYLKGLKMYIKLAEEQRLNVLQSVKGAEKRQINTGDNKQLVVLYERVLPYAVLFGQEKSWLKEMGKYYENTQTKPDWYSGVGAFNAAAFASSVSSFSSYAGSSSFSSSGGGGGGGFSGGGGGGGGGGGR